MRVSIWDLDYYHTEEKVNCFNPDVMKISSYHKQLGDTINFVTTVDDIRRPYDLYYIIKENNKTPNPPLDFFTNRKIRWWGNAYRVRVNWKMSDAMLGCRPDYLLYPEYNTQLERAEHVRFFNNNAELLPIYQDYHNTFKKKKVIVTDKYMWFSDNKSIMIALQRLEETKNLYFLKEIKIQKLLYDEKLKEQFLKLKFTPGVNFKWSKIKHEEFDDALEFLLQIKKLNPEVHVGCLRIDYSNRGAAHWNNKSAALEDFEKLKQIILTCKRNKIRIKVDMPEQALETPYFYLFSVVSEWTWHKSYRHAWLDYLTAKFTGARNEDAVFYWNRPYKWNEVFRDLLRQTYLDREFLLWQWGNNKHTENDIPWKLWEEEFKYGL